MPDCTFSTVELSLCRCRVCGFRVFTSQPAERIHRRCPGSRPAPRAPRLSISTDIAQYILNGQATVSAVEIERRLAICRGCRSFTADNCRRLRNSCARQRDWLWALVGFGGNPKNCPRNQWGPKAEC